MVLDPALIATAGEETLREMAKVYAAAGFLPCTLEKFEEYNIRNRRTLLFRARAAHKADEKRRKAIADGDRPMGKLPKGWIPPAEGRGRIWPEKEKKEAED